MDPNIDRHVTRPRDDAAVRRRTERERRAILYRVERWFEPAMIVLGFVWLLLLVVELTRGLNPFLSRLGQVVWALFIVDFLVKLTVAPRKLVFLRDNVLTLLSLMVPALRIFRVARALRLLRLARATRGLRLVRVVTSVNRGMRALSASLGRRGFGYVAGLTTLVIVAGAAGMYALERNPAGAGLNDFGTALWWTAMLVTTLGSDYWPRTPEGRLLCILLAVYTIGVFGYLTAALASFFIGRDAKSQRGEVAGQASIDALRSEIAALRDEIRALADRG